MNVSTSLNVFDHSVSRMEGIRRCAQAGYVSVDMNYWDYQPQVLQMSWREEEVWARQIREAAELHGVRITQMHGPVHGSTFTSLVSGLTMDSFLQLAERSIQTAAILGVPWVVFHPTDVTKEDDDQDALQYNVDFYRKLIPILEQTGVGIALENLIRSYFSDPEKLVELIDTLNHPLIGACWDTGHAHIRKLDQKSGIMMLGSRLKATHIQDNDGIHDSHLLPYQGTIRWDEVAQALKTIGYQGDFTYETHNSIRNLPDPIRAAGLQYALQLGNYVASLTDD